MTKRKRKKPPVSTGHDDRAEERPGEPRGSGEPRAPDGVSGDWG